MRFFARRSCCFRSLNLLGIVNSNRMQPKQDPTQIRGWSGISRLTAAAVISTSISPTMMTASRMPKTICVIE